jgi:L-asparaginase
MITHVDAPLQNRPIQVFTAGGTIDKIYFDGTSEYEVGNSVLDQLLRDARVAVGVEVVELLRKDSLELTDEDRVMIRAAVAATPCERVVITHGTDTMTDTAAVLADVPDKVMVLTGSFAPARFATTDAAFNVGMAFAAVQTLRPGVYIAMSGQVFDALRVRKDRSQMRFVSL